MPLLYTPPDSAAANHVIHRIRSPIGSGLGRIAIRCPGLAI